MRRMILALAVLFAGGLALGAAAPAQAMTASPLAAVADATQNSNVQQVHWRRYYHRHYHRWYGPRRVCWWKHYRHHRVRRVCIWRW